MLYYIIEFYNLYKNMGVNNSKVYHLFFYFMILSNRADTSSSFGSKSLSLAAFCTQVYKWFCNTCLLALFIKATVAKS